MNTSGSRLFRDGITALIESQRAHAQTEADVWPPKCRLSETVLAAESVVRAARHQNPVLHFPPNGYDFPDIQA